MTECPATPLPARTLVWVLSSATVCNGPSHTPRTVNEENARSNSEFIAQYGRLYRVRSHDIQFRGEPDQFYRYNCEPVPAGLDANDDRACLWDDYEVEPYVGQLEEEQADAHQRR